MRTLIITHIDMDGSGVAIILKKAYPDADIIHVNYGWEDDTQNIVKLDQYDKLIFGDISFSPKFATILNRSGKVVELYDHHESAIRKFTESDTVFDWMTLDVNKCGTLLVYEAVKNHNPDFDPDGDYELLSRLIDDYDRWVHNDYRSIRLQFLWHGLSADNFEDRFINNPKLVFSDEENEVIGISESQLSESLIEAKKSMSDNYYIDCEGLKFNYCSNVPYFVSLVAMMIQKDNPDLDYLALNGGYDGISLRSTKTSVSVIAESLGGGGHMLASGFHIDPMTDVVNSLINRKLIHYEFYNRFNKEGNNEEINS